MNKLIIISALMAICSAQQKACTRPNEHYECGSACQTTCATLGETCTIINIKCNDYCYCNDGYARDQTGNCVKYDVCKDRLNGICGPNEVFKRKTYYKDECTGQILSNGEIPDKRTCGCYCRSGYKRNQKGDCVPENKCTYPPGWIRCTRPHEEYDCRSTCDRTCSNPEGKCSVVYKKCQDACYCSPGYVRLTDESSKCIPYEQCPKSE